MKKSILLFLFALIANFAIAQGIIRGTMIEDATGMPVLFGTVIIDETGDGTTSDMDGAFNFDVPAGTYTLTFQYLGFADLKISDVIVTDGEVTTIDARLKEDSQVIDEVVITAKQTRNNEAALATIKRKSANVIDGISRAAFKRMGDSNAAAAARRVPGVSIQGGKYVFVRGLGDRYTKSLLNNMDIPGLDPDKNTLQMDIFPTNVLDNIIVLKTFTPELPADFTGGVVNIETKDFPEERKMSISGGIGYNPSMHFQSDFLTQEKSGTDWLGVDDGHRAIPTEGLTEVLQYTDVVATSDVNKINAYTSVLNKFNKTLAPEITSSFMDYSVGFSTGDQINTGDNTIGYNLALSYKSGVDFYKDYVSAFYAKNSVDANVTELEQRSYLKGNVGEESVLLGGLAGLAFKTKTSKFKLNLLHLQNGESRSGSFHLDKADNGTNFEAKQHNLAYSERALTNVLLNGNHTLGKGAWKIDWRLSPTFSSQTEPDIRFTRIRVEDGKYSIGTESGVPERIWRYLEEKNYAGKADIVRNLQINEKDAKIKFGVAYTKKERDYEINNFQIAPGNADVTGNPNDFLQDSNLFSAENRQGVNYSPSYLPINPNKYNSVSNVLAGYASIEFNLSEKFKTILGARVEQYDQEYKGVDRRGADLTKKISNTGVFPSLNAIYALAEKTNLRFSATRTIARPSFKEASLATIIDPISGVVFIGGLDPIYDNSDPDNPRTIWDGNLKVSNITNLDLRWEKYGLGGSTVSLSAFYKYFQDPIEIISIANSPSNVQPRNVGDGQVIGTELDVKQGLSTLSESLSDFVFNLNFTYTQSQIKFTQSEIDSRKNQARTGEEIGDSRDMAGQAPFIVNAGLAYKNLDNAFELGLFYNVQGRTLQYVGIADIPDVYSKPFHSLNITANKALGVDNRFSLGLEIDNILGSKRESVYSSYEAADQLFRSKNPATSFSLSLGYKFF